MCGSVHNIILSANILCGLSNSLLGKLVYVVVQFYPWFKFYFPLFWGMVMYDNEFKTKENKILNQGIKLNHNLCMYNQAINMIHWQWTQANGHIQHAKNNKLIFISSPLNVCYPYKLNNNNNKNNANKFLPSVVNDKRHCRLFIQAAYFYFTLHRLKL